MIAPALSAAAFHPDGFNRAARVTVVKRSRFDPARVQELILPTKNRRQALKALKKALGWATTRNNLTVYVGRHHLITNWQKPIDPKRVQELIANVRNARTAVKILKASLTWTTTPAGLKRFLKRHGLTYPWPQRPIDVRRVEELIQAARSRDEAAEILRREWGWYTTPRNLSRFIWRHGIKTPWSLVPQRFQRAA